MIKPDSLIEKAKTRPAFWRLIGICLLWSTGHTFDMQCEKTPWRYERVFIQTGAFFSQKFSKHVKSPGRFFYQHTPAPAEKNKAGRPTCGCCVYDRPQDWDVTGAWGTILPWPPASVPGDCERLPRRSPGSSTSRVFVITLLILRMYT